MYQASILPKQELPIEIADINRVHINHMNIFEPRECQVGQDFASQTTSADHQYLALLANEFFGL